MGSWNRVSSSSGHSPTCLTWPPPAPPSVPFPGWSASRPPTASVPGSSRRSWRRLHQINQGLQVELITSTRLDPYGLGADIEIGVGEPLASRPDAEALTRYRLALYASDAYLEHYGMPATTEELRGHSLVYYVEPLLRVEELNILGQFIGSHRVAVGSTSIHAQVAATRDGAGIGLLPAYLAEPVPELRRVLWDHVASTPTYTAVLAPRQLRRPASTTVMQAIREMVAEKQHLLLP